MKRAPALLIAVIVLAAWYEWFVVEAIWSEAIAAACIAVVGLFATLRTRRVRPLAADLSAGFLKPFIMRVIPAIVRESFELLGPALWRAIVLGRPHAGRWIALRYDPRDSSDAREQARRTIVIFGSNLSPNGLPLDLDADRGRLTLHQLVPHRERAASDSRYPM